MYKLLAKIATKYRVKKLMNNQKVFKYMPRDIVDGFVPLEERVKILFETFFPTWAVMGYNKGEYELCNGKEIIWVNLCKEYSNKVISLTLGIRDFNE